MPPSVQFIEAKVAVSCINCTDTDRHDCMRGTHRHFLVCCSCVVHGCVDLWGSHGHDLAILHPVRHRRARNGTPLSSAS